MNYNFFFRKLWKKSCVTYLLYDFAIAISRGLKDALLLTLSNFIQNTHLTRYSNFT